MGLNTAMIYSTVQCTQNHFEWIPDCEILTSKRQILDIVTIINGHGHVNLSKNMRGKSPIQNYGRLKIIAGHLNERIISPIQGRLPIFFSAPLISDSICNLVLLVFVQGKMVINPTKNIISAKLVYQILASLGVSVSS